MSEATETKTKAAINNNSNLNLSQESTALQFRERHLEQRTLNKGQTSNVIDEDKIRDPHLARVDENELNHVRQARKEESAIVKSDALATKTIQEIPEVKFHYQSEQPTPEELAQHKVLLKVNLEALLPQLDGNPEGEKLRLELTQYMEKLQHAENFRNGTTKTIENLKAELESVDHWYSFRRGEASNFRAHIQNEETLLFSQLQREKELREELTRATKEAEWIVKLISVGRNHEAEIQGTEINQSLKRNSSTIDVGATKAALAQGQKITAQQLASLPSANPFVNLGRAVNAVKELIYDPLVDLGIQALLACGRAAIWIQQTLPKVITWVKEVGSTIGEQISKLWSLATDPNNRREIWKDLVEYVFTPLMNTASKVWDTIKDPANWLKALKVGMSKAFWNDVFSSIGTGAVAVWTAASNLLEAGWGAIKESGILKTIGDAYSKAWNAICTKEFWASVGMGILKGIAAVGKFCLDVLTDPVKAWETVKTVGKFAWQVLNDLGVVDLVVGLVKLTAAPFAFILGHTAAILRLALDFVGVVAGLTTAEQMKKNYQSMVAWANDTGYSLGKGGLTALKGAATLIGQVSGIMDLGLMVMFALQGNFAMAGICAAGVILSWGSIGATIATAGAAGGAMIAVLTLRSSLKTAAQQALKVAAKEFLEVGAKQIGETIVKDLSKTLTTETIETVGKKIATEGAEQMAKFVAKHGSKEFTHELVKDVMKEVATHATEKMLSEAGLQKIVKENVLTFFEKCVGKSQKELQVMLAEMGVKSNSAAKHLSKELKAAVKKGKIPSRITDQLEEGITKEVTSFVEKRMEEPFKKQFASILKGEMESDTSKILSKAVKEQATFLGKHADELVDELVESGWKGVREGIQDAARSIVKAGIAEALKEFKNAHTKIPHLSFATTEENFKHFEAVRAKVLAEMTVAGVELKEVVQAERKEDSKMNEIEQLPQEIRVETAEMGDETIRKVYVRRGNSEWELSSAETIARAIKIAAKNATKVEEEETSGKKAA